jgi:hypothetical protein
VCQFAFNDLLQGSRPLKRAATVVGAQQLTALVIPDRDGPLLRCLVQDTNAHELPKCELLCDLVRRQPFVAGRGLKELVGVAVLFLSALGVVLLAVLGVPIVAAVDRFRRRDGLRRLDGFWRQLFFVLCVVRVRIWHRARPYARPLIARAGEIP